MTALLLAMSLTLGGGDASARLLDVSLTPAGAAGDSGAMHPALLVAAEGGAGLGLGLLSVPALYFVAWGISGFGALRTVSLGTVLFGLLLLPPTAAAGGAWAVADLDAGWQAPFEKVLAVTASVWAVLVGTGIFFVGDFWSGVRLIAEPHLFVGHLLPWALLGATVLSVSAVVAIQVFRTPRVGNNHWRDYRKTEPEPDFGRHETRPPESQQASLPPPSFSLPLWAGAF